MAIPCTIRLTQQGTPGACRAFVVPFGPADSRASVIVTLFSAPRGGRSPSAYRHAYRNRACTPRADARTTRHPARPGGVIV
ncbi:hypothetical protein GCM10010317_068720 [Streptomyces mirabilis]|nr:hypothetical protein GCM10010317_068720 [Streptomyces mirabilis]